MRGQLSWKQGGFALGLVFFIAILLVKPIGVSTQFVIFDGMLWSLFSKELITQDEAPKPFTSQTRFSRFTYKCQDCGFPREGKDLALS